MKIFITFALIIICKISYSQDIFNAARTNDTTMLTKFIGSNVKIDTTDQRGSTPLIIAVYNENVAAAKLLLMNGANPNAQDRSGNTALIWELALKDS
ncbi:ankyrin repeat domain-containing protein [Pedobacter sp. NJ-S-72]